MSRKVKTLTPDERMVDAFEGMQEHRIRHIPVVNKGKVVGILSDRDVRPFLPTRGAMKGPTYSKSLMETRIKDVMSRKPVTISEFSTLREAAELLCRERIGALPVVDDGKLEGIITTEDVLWAFVDSLQNHRDSWEE